MTRGFTLVELVIVFGIIGVMAALVVPDMRPNHDWKDASECWADARTLAGALEMERLPFDAASVKTLKAARLLDETFPRVGHSEPFPYVLVARTEEIACLEHGLKTERRWLTPREQLEERHFTDAGVLARASTRPISRHARTDQYKKRTLKALGVAGVAWVVILLCQLAVRVTEGKKPGDADVAQGVMVALSIGISFWVVLAYVGERGADPPANRYQRPAAR